MDNFLDAMTIHDPTRIILKPKLHILTHVIEDIRRLGPAVQSSTETFESFNAVFRQCSVLSNRHSPSHDIAKKFAEMDGVKHIICGGYWMFEGQWIQAGKGICSYLKDCPALASYLGWTSRLSKDPGWLQFSEAHIV